MPSCDHCAAAALLTPHSREQFERDVWEQRPLVIRRKPPALYAELAPARLLSAVQAQLGSGAGVMQVFRDGRQLPPGRLCSDFVAGGSIVVNRIDLHCAPVGRLCASLRPWLHHAFGVLYLTPRGCRAVLAHSDDQDVFVLQLAGRKRWRLYGAPTPLPYSHEQVGKASAIDAAALGPPELEVTLEEGHLLYVPRGVVHEAEAAEGSCSLHLTLTVQTSDSTWFGCIADSMSELMRQDDAFRTALPLQMPQRSPTASGEKVATAQEGEGRADRPEGKAEAPADPDGQMHMASMLEALIARLDAAQEQGFEIALRRLQEKLRRHNEAQDAAIVQAERIEEEDPPSARIRRAHGVQVDLHDSASGPAASVRVEQKEVELNVLPSLMPAVRHVLAAGPSTVVDASTLPGVDAIEGMALADHLLHLGIMEYTPA